MAQKAIVTFVKNDYGFAKTEKGLSVFFHFSNERCVGFLQHEHGKPYLPSLYLSYEKKLKLVKTLEKGTVIFVDVVDGKKGAKADRWGIAPSEAPATEEVPPLYRVVKHTRFVGNVQECTPEVKWEGSDIDDYEGNPRIDFFSCDDFDSWITKEKFENGEWINI